jgi:hypothetical protein
MSPASYLTAPPRVAAASVAATHRHRGAGRRVVSIARISLLVVLPALSLIAAVASAGYAVGGFVQLLRDARAAGSALGEGLDRVAVAAERASVRAEELSRGSGRLEASLDRLAASRARLSVLLEASADARAAIGSLVFIPRK